MTISATPTVEGAARQAGRQSRAGVIARQPKGIGKAPGIDRDPRPHFERNRAARIDFIDENAGGPVLAC
jgi:hypothetical protein